MKKFCTSVLLVIIGIAVGLAASLAVYYVTGDKIFAALTGGRPRLEATSIGTDTTNAQLTAYAFEILCYIKAGDYEALAQVVHPEYGVVFSPYATINLASNKVFTATQIVDFADDENKYVWGKYDGKGDLIELTPSEYFETFVFDKDYTLASEIGVDTVIRSGNSLENVKEQFPSARFVDFHVPGTDEASGGLDWRSLRLCFEEYNGEMKLTVILHSEWTI